MSDIAVRTAVDQGKSPEQLLAERTKRVMDAAEMKQPDRIPIALRYGYFMSDILGCSHADVYKADKMQAALEKACGMFQPDYYGSIVGTPGHSRILGDQMTKWPGYNLPDSGSFQYDEHEYMKADEYDALIRDPADWALRFYTPRIFSELTGLGKLPHFGLLLMGYYGMAPIAGQMADPDIVHAFKKLAECGEFHQKWFAEQRAIGAHMRSLGYPSNPFIGAQVAAPFDFMSDTLRGMHGIFMDMFRRADKLMAAQRAVCDLQIQYAIEYNRPRNFKYVFIPLHRGSGGFMDMQQFKRFYWPEHKRLMMGLIDGGLVPFVFYEGVWDKERLELLTELPKGKSIGYFQDGDFAEIKAIVGDVMSLMGGMPVSTLQLGTVDQVRDRTKYLCEVVGKGGGYIMTSNIGDLEGCKPHLIKAWVEATQEFGTY
jgi:hypothetical protein